MSDSSDTGAGLDGSTRRPTSSRSRRSLTGLWILTGGEGHPSPLARITGIGDTELHVWLGRALAVLVLALFLGGPRAIVPFVRETLRHDGGDGRWWVRLPAAVVTGRFARHEGTFDPGQRLANVAIVGGLLVLTGTGLGLTIVHGGSSFVAMATIHRWGALVVTAAIAVHVFVAAGILPGYRGVWRSMHLRRQASDRGRSPIVAGVVRTLRGARARHRRDGPASRDERAVSCWP